MARALIEQRSRARIGQKEEFAAVQPQRVGKPRDSQLGGMAFVGFEVPDVGYEVFIR
jgi:hypothetical protein